MPQGTIDRETFIAAYVDLRHEILVSSEGVLSDADRERVLRGHGVSEDELVAFAEARGADVEYMAGVWTDVEARLTTPVAEPDSTG